MYARKLAAMFLIGCFVAAGCSKSDSDDKHPRSDPAFKTGSVKVSLLAPADFGLTRVNVTVTGSGIDAPISADLTPSVETFSGVIPEIPAGPARLFTAKAYRDAEVKCTGSATGDIVAGERAQIAMTLECVPDPETRGEAEIDGGFNFPPRIDTAYASKSSVETGGTIALSVTGSDPNTGDTLTYAWSATAGTFSAWAATSTVYTAPAFAGNQTITITVTDNHGAVTALDVVIEVVAVGSGAHWVSIPGGTFSMGDALDGLSDAPVYAVTISTFQMYAYEVTNGEYEACVSAASCTAPGNTGSYSRSPYYGNATYADYPVIYVNWQQATGFCTWAGGRLPTEAEWEYAARGGLSGKRFPWGDTIDCSKANYYSNPSYAYDTEGSTGYCVGDTSQVGDYAANGYGLYDMAGNVYEWVNDWYDSSYYSSSPSTDPQGPASGTSRVLRDGGFVTDAPYARVAYRNYYTPTFQYSVIGFRCAR